jgi:hypothetical protein
MEILSFNKKGLHFDTIEGFYIYNEETFNNQLNDKHAVCSKKIFIFITNKERRRYIPTLPLYSFSFPHSLTPTIPPHTPLPVTPFDHLADDYIRHQRLQDDGCTFWILDTVLL